MSAFLVRLEPTEALGSLLHHDPFVEVSGKMDERRFNGNDETVADLIRKVNNEPNSVIAVGRQAMIAGTRSAAATPWDRIGAPADTRSDCGAE